ncbi:MAG: UvrB/UvrC motif-containing protein, partial [Draconibacterium sp.]
ITPRAIVKPTREIIGYEYRSDKQPQYDGGMGQPDIAADPVVQYMSIDGLEKAIDKTQKQMKAAAKELDFIEAARLRDEMFALQNILQERRRELEK